MILHPCTWPPTATAAWEWWLAQSLICSSRRGRVNRNCKILFLFFFLSSFGCIQLQRCLKNTARYDFKITECTCFSPPFYIYGASQLACQVKKCWRNQAVTWMGDVFFKSWCVCVCVCPDVAGQLKVHTESTAPLTLSCRHFCRLNVHHPHIVSWFDHFYTQH